MILWKARNTVGDVSYINMDKIVRISPMSSCETEIEMENDIKILVGESIESALEGLKSFGVEVFEMK